MAEWLRRWTRNPMGIARAGSNPARSDFWSVDKSSKNFMFKAVKLFYVNVFIKTLLQV